MSDTREQIRELLRVEDDISAVQVVAQLDLDPDEWLGEIKGMLDEGGPWSDCDFQNPESGVYTDERLKRQQWMGRTAKLPYAPWGDEDAPAECNAADCPAATADEPECDCDARYKWSHEPLYVDGETVAMAEDDPQLDGRVFIQTDDDPYAFVDGDDVRCPDTGEVHPEFVAILNALGLTYADISTSGSGVHANYRGELPNDIPEASWEIDDEPWGDNDDTPTIELYANKHVCVATGEHVRGSGTEIAEWDHDAVEALLDEQGLLRQTTTERSDFDNEDYTPDATDADETTTDIRDQFAAVNRLDPKRVADATIVSKWNDSASTSSNARAFWPTWGSTNRDSGTANYVNDKIWHDTGDEGGYGGPAVMALIDAGEIRHAGASPSDASGANWFTAMDHLRDLGFEIPKYVGDDDEPDLDIVTDEPERGVDPMAEAEAVANTPPAETDGGNVETTAEPATPDTGTVDPFRNFSAKVLNAIEEQSDERITAKTCRHRIAEAFTDYYDFIYPGDDVRGWVSTLYVYNRDQGVYEPRGEEFIKQKLETAAYDYVTNQVKNEVIGKVERMSIESAGRFERGGGLQPEPYEIVVNNGILNLKTGELSPFSPTEYHRTKIDVRWNPEAGNPDAIDDFLHDIVDDSDVPTLYRLIAHTLYKEYIAEKAAILIGSGQNGKSVFLDLIEHFVGRWNVSHRELQDFDDDGFAANNLQGKLANLATEIGEQELRDTTVFKKLTGRDTLDARVKYTSPVTFENYATMMFATNEMPVFGQDNHAIWRRWVYVDFPYTFGDGDDEKPATPKSVLMDRLTDDSELESLLWRCQQEIQRWHENGEDFFADAMPPEEVREQMKKAAEPVYNFATSCLEQGDPEEDFVEKEIVRAAYRAYADEEDLPRVPENEFGSRLLNVRDFTMEATQRRVDGGRPHVYEGVTLSSRGRQVLGLDEPEDDDQQQVDDGRQATAIVMDELRAMAEENDGEPVPREGVIWRCSGEITKTQADNAIDDLLEKGDAMTRDGGETLLPTDV